jgi:HSP20 family protein
MIAPTRWRPATDVCETPEAITLTIELAGVREEDLDIELYADAVVVEGHRAPQTCGTDAVYHALEIRHGDFRVEVALPGGIDGDQPSATLDNGFLRIMLPKAAGTRVPLDGPAR